MTRRQAKHRAFARIAAKKRTGKDVAVFDESWPYGSRPPEYRHLLDPQRFYWIRHTVSGGTARTRVWEA